MDTNVAVVANERAPQASPDCVTACINALLAIQREQCLLVDDGGLILEEYRRHLSPSGQPGVGDAFFKWIWNNQGHPERCRRTTITPCKDRRFVEFPDDAALAGFDADDRKFVAVALASREDPPILNATDTDWWHHREVLVRHGLALSFLCPELMQGD